MKKTTQQKAIDNRANQLNPNNPTYYKSRMGNPPKKNNNHYNKNNSHNTNNNRGNTKNNQKTVIVHHHNHFDQKPAGNQTRVCPICGAIGNVSFVRNKCKKYIPLTNTAIGKKTVLQCNSCGGTFEVKRKD